MRRILLATGFATFATALALCAALYLEHSAAVGEVVAQGQAERLLRVGASEGELSADRAPMRPLFALRLGAGETVRFAALWTLTPDLECDNERLRRESEQIPEVFDRLRIVWLEERGGEVREVGVQRLAAAPSDGEAGWSRLPTPFVRSASAPLQLGAVVREDPGPSDRPSLACWSLRVAGQRTMPLRGRDVTALVALLLSLVVLLAGMWLPVRGGAGDEKPLAWGWIDAAVPVGVFAAWLALGGLVPWSTDDLPLRLLQQVPFSLLLGLGLALAVAHGRSRAPLEALGGRGAGHAAWIAVAVGAGMTLAGPAAWLREAMVPSDAVAAASWVPGSVLALASATVAAALAEEVLWRGLIFEVAAARLGRGWAVAVSAVPFAAAHWIGRESYPWALGIVAVLAVALGLLRARTGSLVPCVAMHASYNLTLVLLGQVA